MYSWSAGNTALNNISENDGARQKRSRVGRGTGSGKGKTGGRGQKGQKSRSGVAIKGFEGGQMPLHRRLPKRGFKCPTREEKAAINLSDIQRAINNGRLDAKDTIDGQVLAQAGIIHDDQVKLVKLLAKGEIDSAISIRVPFASASAVRKVEAAGGRVDGLVEPKKPRERRRKAWSWTKFDSVEDGEPDREHLSQQGGRSSRRGYRDKVKVKKRDKAGTDHYSVPVSSDPVVVLKLPVVNSATAAEAIIRQFHESADNLQLNDLKALENWASREDVQPEDRRRFGEILLLALPNYRTDDKGSAGARCAMAFLDRDSFKDLKTKYVGAPQLLMDIIAEFLSGVCGDLNIGFLVEVSLRSVSPDKENNILKVKCKAGIYGSIAIGGSQTRINLSGLSRLKADTSITADISGIGISNVDQQPSETAAGPLKQYMFKFDFDPETNSPVKISFYSGPTRLASSIIWADIIRDAVSK